MLSITFLVFVVLLLVGLSFKAPLHYLLGFSLLLVATAPGYWNASGLLFDPEDLVYTAVILNVLLRGKKSGEVRPKIPYLWLWLLLVGFFSLSYVSSPWNAPNLTDPPRILYQLYRYAWKPLLFYPFAAVFLSQARTTRAMVFTVIAAGVLCALQSIPQGYAGARADGPLGSANALGATLVVPIAFTFILLIVSSGSFKRRAIFAACMLVLVRGLLFSGSRGAVAATLFGLGLAGLFMLRMSGTRSALIRFVAPITLVGVLIMLIPGVLDRPNIRRALSVSEGTSSSTMQWRIENRWWYFLDQAYASPWVGTGRAVDRRLGDEANTPHSGYIALAVKRGFPALTVYMIFSILAIWAGLRVFRDPRPNPWGPITGALCVTTLGAVLLHNVVESNFETPFLGKLFWMYVALPLVASQALKDAPAAAPVIPRPPRARLAEPSPASDAG